MRRAIAFALMLAAFALCVGTLARAGMLGGVGQLMMPGQLQANPVLTSRITTESGITITTEAGDPLRIE